MVVDTAVAWAMREGNVISGRGAKIQARGIGNPTLLAADSAPIDRIRQGRTASRTADGARFGAFVDALVDTIDEWQHYRALLEE